MNKMIELIIKKNSSLFGPNPNIEKINVGFTNTIYKVNDTFIIKVCTNIENENHFKKEIEFYKTIKNNNLIPKLLFFSTDKKEIPYMYEILEKIEGVTLYNVWHKLEESERENIIKQLCEAMKQFHSNKGKPYDWVRKTIDLFNQYFDQAKKRQLFTAKEIDLLNNAYQKFPELLKTDEFVLVHNDLHFDNIFYNNGKIKLIDFERSLYAPKEFELDILYRMIRKPWKFASEENEQYTKASDYENIITYIEKYYPEIIQIPNLYKRLAIYDMVYYFKHFVKNPHIEELKTDILTAAKKLV